MSQCSDVLKGRLSSINFEVVNKFKSRNRNYLFDPTTISNDTIDKALHGETEDLFSSFAERKGLVSKLQSLLYPEKVSAFTSLFDPIIEQAKVDGRPIGYKELSIATNVIIDALKSERNVVKNAAKSLKSSERKVFQNLFIDHSNNNASTAPTSRVFSTIGKQVLLSQGQIISKSASLQEMEDTYYNIGKHLVDVLTTGENPVFKISTGNMVTFGLQKEDGSYYNNSGSGLERYYMQVPVIAFNYNGHEAFKTFRHFENMSAIAKAITTTALPSKMLLPSTEATEFDPKQSNVKVGESTTELINTLQKQAWYIKPSFVQMLLELRKMYDENSNQSYVRNAGSKVSSNAKVLQEFFGLVKVDHDDLFSESEVGKMITKTNALEDVIQNLHEFVDLDTSKPKPMFFNYFISRNDRLHQLETVLNFQSDKYLARQILSTGEAVEYTDKEDIEYLINGLMEDIGTNKDGSPRFTEDQILGKDKSNKKLETVLAGMHSKTKDVADNQISVMKYIADNRQLKGSAWREYSIISAIKDIRNAVNSDGKLTSLKTDYMVESDATASGVMIKLLQEAGRSNSSIMEKLKSLGFSQKGSKPFTIEIADVYAFIGADKYIKEITDEIISNDESKRTMDLISNQSRALYALDLLTKDLGYSMRDLSKMLTMKFNYEQKPDNVKLEFANDYAKEIMDKFKKHPDDLHNLLQKVVEDPHSTANSIPKSQDGQYNMLSDYLAETVGTYLVQVAEDIFTNDITKESKKEIKEIGEASAALAVASNGKYSMAAPSALEYVKAKLALGDKFDYNSFMKNYSMPMTKVREVVVGKTNDGSLLMSNVAISNPTSMFVNVVHSMDKAILLMAYENLIKDHPELKDKSPMFIHDAAKGNASFNRLYDPYYRDALMTMSREYDIVDAHLQELKRGMTFVDESSSAYKKAQAKIDMYEASTQARINLKRQLLDGMQMPNAFGQMEKGFKIKSDNQIEEAQETQDSKSEEQSEEVNNEQSYKPKEGEKKPISYVLDRFKNSKHNALMNLLTSMNNAVNIYISKIDKNNYTPDGNSIFLRPDASNEQILHEFLHAATIHNIHDIDTPANVKATARLTKIREQASKVLPAELVLLWDNKQTHYDKNEEFMAYGLSNPDVIAALQKQPSLWSAFKNIIARLLGLSTEDKNSLYGDLMGVLNSYNRNNIKSKIFKDSMAYRYYYGSNINDDSESTSLTYKEYVGNSKDIGIDMFAPVTSINTQLSDMITHKMIPYMEKNAPKLFDKLDVYATDKYPAYKSLKEILTDTWENNEFIQQMKPYLNLGTAAANSLEMRKQMMNIVHEAEQKKSHQESADVAKLDKALQANYTKDEIITLDTIFARTGLGAITRAGMLQAIAEGRLTVDNAISDVIGAYKGNKLNLEKAADTLSKLYVNGDVLDINKKSSKDYFPVGSVDRNALDVLAALYSLKLIPGSEKMIQDMYSKHNELYNQMTFYNMAISTVHQKLFDITGDNFGGIGNIVEDVYDRSPNIQAISFKDLRDGKYPLNRGWKILQEPIEGKQYGIVYNKSETGGYQAGYGTNISHIKYGLEIAHPDSKITSGNFIQNGSKISLVLTPEQKQELGLIANPAHTLVRTYARLQYAIETNKVREEILTNTNVIRELKNTDDIDNLIQEIKSQKGTNKEGTHPWFIKLDSKMTLSTLPVELQHKYKMVENASDIGGFNKKVQLVRTDLASQVMGYKEIDVFPSVPWLNRMAHVTKKLITLRKIHQVVANPTKLAKDTISNNVLLAQMGVPLQDIVKHSKEALEGIKDLVQLRNEVILAEFNDNALNTSATKAELKRLRDKLSNHLLAPAIANGFIQSMGTDLLHRNYDTVTGLQHDIEDVINKVVKNPDGSFNGLGKTINEFGTFGGIGIDSIIGYVGKTLKGKAKSADAVANILTNMANGWKESREGGDPAKYLSQFIAAPDSELVKAGSGIMQYSDFVARWTLYKHLKNSGVSEKEAVDKALEMFIDYRVNMPKELKMLSDYGVLMYPTYWTRIQKVIMMATMKNPVLAGTGIVTEGLLGNVLPTIYDSNIVTKATSYSGLLNSPTDVVNFDTLLPNLIP